MSEYSYSSADTNTDSRPPIELCDVTSSRIDPCDKAGELEDRQKLKKTTCYACRAPIADEYIMFVIGKTWHDRCLKCAICSVPLSLTCYYKSGSLYCYEHWDELKSTPTYCARCDKPIMITELIHKSGEYVYHKSCFYCDICSHQFNAGDIYYTFPYPNTRLICMDSGNKRPRTSITQGQLDMLKKAFRDSNKPARHVREELSKQTGLDKRVVQVWFQNRRAKEKRRSKGQNKAVESTTYSSMLGDVALPQPLPSHITAWPPLLCTTAKHPCDMSSAELHPSNHSNSQQCLDALSHHMASFLANGLPPISHYGYR